MAYLPKNTSNPNILPLSQSLTVSKIQRKTRLRAAPTRAPRMRRRAMSLSKQRFFRRNYRTFRLPPMVKDQAPLNTNEADRNRRDLRVKKKRRKRLKSLRNPLSLPKKRHLLLMSLPSLRSLGQSFLNLVKSKRRLLSNLKSPLFQRRRKKNLRSTISKHSTQLPRLTHPKWKRFQKR